jgi:WD domain, G-beta repeat
MPVGRGARHQRVPHAEQCSVGPAGQDGTARLWQLDGSATESSADAATLVAVYSGHADSVAALAAAPGGEHFASGGWDGAIHIWRAGGLPLHCASPGLHIGGRETSPVRCTICMRTPKALPCHALEGQPGGALAWCGAADARLTGRGVSCCCTRLQAQPCWRRRRRLGRRAWLPRGRASGGKARPPMPPMAPHQLPAAHPTAAQRRARRPLQPERSRRRRSSCWRATGSASPRWRGRRRGRSSAALGTIR